MRDLKSKQTMALRRSKGVFVLDAYVVPYALVKNGTFTIQLPNGQARTINLKNSLDVQGLIR